ncbi:MAG: site-2 protease family protein [Acidobacteria bacterium]|nr:MAG: site-2 protease family protein [Acidobacteriota bacterium]
MPPDRPRRWLPAVLFLATLCTTTAAGIFWYTGFVDRPLSDATGLLGILTDPSYLLGGLSFSLAILIILIAHELGHYLTCVRYGIRASLPHLLPVPPFAFGFPLNPFGTFGAVIRIRSPFENKRQLFDIGIAGPLAGFVFIIPALILGLAHSREFVLEGSEGFYLNFGEPLLFKLAARLLVGNETAYITLHPVGWAAWFGMLATSLNLLPVGQLDGGHIVYAVLGPRWHRIVSIGTLTGLVVLGAATFSISYILFAALIFLLAFRHPAPVWDYPPLDAKRIILAIVALIILVLTFIPEPVEVVEYTNHL